MLHNTALSVDTGNEERPTGILLLVSAPGQGHARQAGQLLRIFPRRRLLGVAPMALGSAEYGSRAERSEAAAGSKDASTQPRHGGLAGPLVSLGANASAGERQGAGGGRVESGAPTTWSRRSARLGSACLGWARLAYAHTARAPLHARLRGAHGAPRPGVNGLDPATATAWLPHSRIECSTKRNGRGAKTKNKRRRKRTQGGGGGRGGCREGSLQGGCSGGGRGRVFLAGVEIYSLRLLLKGKTVRLRRGSCFLKTVR